MNEVNFGFEGQEPKPCSVEAATFAKAVIGMIEAERDLCQSQAVVPDYTGQWSPEDYYAEELEAWYRAAESLLEAAKRATA